MTAYEIRISDWSSDVCSSDLMSSLWRVADGIIRAGAAWHGQRRTDVIARPAGDFLSAERGPSGTHQPATDDAAVADGRSKGVDPVGRDLCRLHAGGRAGAHRGGRAGDAAADPRALSLMSALLAVSAGLPRVGTAPPAVSKDGQDTTT